MSNGTSLNDAIHLKNNGKPEEAEKILRQLIANRQDADKAWYHLALIATDRGDIGSAMECYEAALEINPRYFKAANNLGIILLKQEEYRGAYYSFKMAHEEAPGDLFPLYNMATAVYGLRDYKTALEHYLQVKEMPGYASLPADSQKEMIISMADCYLNEKKVDEAEQYYKEAAGQPGPHQLRAFNQLAFIALEIRHDYAAALEWIDQALAIDADFKPSVQNKGLILKGMGKLEEALPLLEKVIALAPDGFEGYYNLACLHCARRYEQQAREAVEKALQLAPFIKDHLRQDPDFAPYAGTEWFRNLVR